MRYVCPVVLVAALAAFAVLSATASAPRAAAATPTPTATATPTATPFPPGATVLRVHVINDLNSNGARDPGEPGVSGWNVIVSCGDAIARAGPTDAQGNIATTLSPYKGEALACPAIERGFGWLPTSPPNGRVAVREGEAGDITFLVHDFGRSAMEISGEAIAAGIPAAVALTVSAPFAECAGAFNDTPNPTSYSRATLIIASGTDAPGCPRSRDAVTVAVDGIHAFEIDFAPATRQSRDFVARGDSMRLYGTEFTGAQIDGRACGVVFPATGGLVPPGWSRIAVLSDEARPGCGVEGRLVRFFKNGAPVDPLVPWHAGAVAAGIVFTPATDRPALTPPNAGDGASRATAARPRATILLAALGVLLAASGFALRHHHSRTL